MNNLINVKTIIINETSINSVSARELYIGLGLSPNNWTEWYKTNIINNEFFTQGIDFELLLIMRSADSPKPPQDFAISIDFAKHIAMQARTQKSHDYRQYFIDFEKQHNKPLSAIDGAIMALQETKRLEETMAIQNERIRAIEAKQGVLDQHVRDFSTMAYGNIMGKPLTIQQATALGRKASALSRKLGMPIGNIRDQRFGHVNTYVEEVLMRVWAESMEN